MAKCDFSICWFFVYVMAYNIYSRLSELCMYSPNNDNTRRSWSAFPKFAINARPGISNLECMHTMDQLLPSVDAFILPTVDASVCILYSVVIYTVKTVYNKRSVYAICRRIVAQSVHQSAMVYSSKVRPNTIHLGVLPTEQVSFCYHRNVFMHEKECHTS